MHPPSPAAPAATATAPALRAAIAHAARELGLDAIGVTEIQLEGRG
jgi:hypothetical protein